MNTILPRMCLGLLLTTASVVASATETVADVLQDQQTHGYRSVSAALHRLQHASDVPDDKASLQARLTYQNALLDMALEGNQVTLLRTSVKALEGMAEREHCQSCRFRALLANAWLALRYDSVTAARPYLAQAIALSPSIQDPIAQERFLALRGNVDAQDRKLNLGIEYTMQALGMAESRGDAAAALRLRGSLIWMNTDLGDLSRAISLGEEAYTRAAALDYRTMMARISLDLGHTYALSGDRDRQRKTIERALALSADSPDLLSTRILGLNNLSDFYLAEPGQDQRVLEYARQAEALARANDREINRAAPLTNMGLALARMGKLEEGITDIRQAITISQRKGVMEYVVGITRELVGVLERAGRYKEALVELRKADTLEQDLTHQQREKAVLELQEKYAAERKSQQIVELSAQNALKQAQLAAENWRNRLWTVLALLLAVGSAVLMRSIRGARQANRQLAVANQTLARQSTIDPLTDVFNRRHAQTLLEQVQLPQRARRSNDDIREDGTGLLMLDLDFFKHINDNWGHAAGDAVLVAVAQRLRNLLRQEDMIARWGGEEFVLVLPNTPARALPAIAGKVLEAIGDTPVRAGSERVDVTASLGAVSLPMFPGQDWQAALGIADLALYQAKAGGRNRAVCVTAVVPHGDFERINGDLALAQQAGDVDLTVVCGPARSCREAPVAEAVFG